MGVVYYANFLKWFEMGRTELLRDIGVPYSSIEVKGLCFPVTEVSCRYYRPARYDERLMVETTLTSLGGVTMTFCYRIYRQDDELLLASGWTKHACVDLQGEVTKMPPNLKDMLKAAVLPSPSNTRPNERARETPH
jgi:acyl-CoA thioester hydrolase